MKRVFSSLNVAMVRHLQNVLENNGIDCMVKGEFLAGAMGEIPLTEAWTELWVDDSRVADAMRVLEERAPEGSTTGSWTCECGERIEGQFTECWSCGARPDPPAGT